MALHASLSANEILRLSDGEPCVYCGDFNFKTADAPYELLTTGTITDHSVYEVPDPKYDPSFVLAEYDLSLLEPFISAYKEFNGEEPNYTNYALTGYKKPPGQEPEPFCDTLDYIFITEGIEVTDVLQLAHRDDSDGPYPSPTEPSDHIKLRATITLSSAPTDTASEQDDERRGEVGGMLGDDSRREVNAAKEGERKSQQELRKTQQELAAMRQERDQLQKQLKEARGG
jgi:hypothetical protein